MGSVRDLELTIVACGLEDDEFWTSRLNRSEEHERKSVIAYFNKDECALAPGIRPYEKSEMRC